MAGLAPTTTLGVNLIVGAAPPEQAGAVSGLGQAGNELGGALGIALLGTVGTAVYRGDMDGVARGAAGDTIGGAVELAGRVPSGVLDAAADAFAHGMHVAAVLGGRPTARDGRARGGRAARGAGRPAAALGGAVARRRAGGGHRLLMSDSTAAGRER
jgi:hypothetical protein